MPGDLVKIAQTLRQEILDAKFSHAGFLDGDTVYQNPIAVSYLLSEDKALDVIPEDASAAKKIFQPAGPALVKQLETDIKLVIQKEDLSILQTYYEARIQETDFLGKLYREIQFYGFIRRLYLARYQSAYFATSEMPDDLSFSHPDHSKASELSTQADFQKKLCLEEVALAHLVLPVFTSVVIGTGSNLSYRHADFANECQESASLVCFSSPGAIEFLDGSSIHYDAFRLLYSPDEVLDCQAYYQKLNPAFRQAMNAIYGPAYRPSQMPDKDPQFVKVNILSKKKKSIQHAYLHKSAYLRRMKKLLSAILLAADREMMEKGLGTTFQLSGLSLNYLGLNHSSDELEKLLIEALKQVLVGLNLVYIKKMNLINFPSGKDNEALRVNPRELFQITDQDTGDVILVYQSNMFPLHAVKYADTLSEIGGAHFTGDSATWVGNVANIGGPRTRGEDDALLFALLNPGIMNPEFNAGRMQIVLSDPKEKVFQILSPAYVSLVERDQIFKDNRIALRAHLENPKNLPKRPYFPDLKRLKIEALLLKTKNAAFDKTSLLKETLLFIFQLDNALLVDLILQLKDRNLFFHDRQFVRSGFFANFRTHETTRTWADLLEASHVRFFLNLANAFTNANPKPGTFYCPSANEEAEHQAFILLQSRHKWMAEKRKTKLWDDLHSLESMGDQFLGRLQKLIKEYESKASKILSLTKQALSEKNEKESFLEASAITLDH